MAFLRNVKEPPSKAKAAHDANGGLPHFLGGAYGRPRLVTAAGPSHPIESRKVSVHPAVVAPILPHLGIRPTAVSKIGASANAQERAIARGHTKSAGPAPKYLQRVHDARSDRNIEIAHTDPTFNRNLPRPSLDRATGRTQHSGAFSRMEFLQPVHRSFNMRRGQGP
jgi:hypothetical protein